MRLFRRATATPNSKYPTKVGCVFQLPSIALTLRQKGHMLLRKGVVAGQHQHNPLDCSTASGQRYSQAARHILCHSSQQLPGSGDVQTQQQSVKLPTELQGFRPNVGMCVFHPQKGVFAATRVDDPGKSWQMPQGGIDPGEDPQAAALRVSQRVRVSAAVPPGCTHPVPSSGAVTWQLPQHCQYLQASVEDAALCFASRVYVMCMCLAGCKLQLAQPQLQLSQEGITSWLRAYTSCPCALCPLPCARSCLRRPASGALRW
jgi:hypothetical protein